MVVKLTDRSVAAAIGKAQREGKRVEVSDAKAPGLVLRASPSGSAVWVLRVQATEGGRRHFRRFKVGDYPGLGLAAAREHAGRLRLEVADGRVPSPSGGQPHRPSPWTLQSPPMLPTTWPPCERQLCVSA